MAGREQSPSRNRGADQKPPDTGGTQTSGSKGQERQHGVKGYGSELRFRSRGFGLEASSLICQPESPLPARSIVTLTLLANLTIRLPRSAREVKDGQSRF